MAESLASATAPAGLAPGAWARNVPASYRMIDSSRPYRRTSRLAFGSGGDAAGMIPSSRAVGKRSQGGKRTAFRSAAHCSRGSAVKVEAG